MAASDGEETVAITEVDDDHGATFGTELQSEDNNSDEDDYVEHGVRESKIKAMKISGEKIKPTIPNLLNELLTCQQHSDQLTRKLNTATQRISRKEAEWNTAREEINKATREILLLRKTLEEERNDKKRLEERFQKFRNSTTILCEEFVELSVFLEKHFEECGKNPRRWGPAEEQRLQNRLDKLSLYCDDKFESWSVEHLIMQEGFVQTKETLAKLQKFCEESSSSPKKSMSDAEPQGNGQEVGSPSQNAEQVFILDEDSDNSSSGSETAVELEKSCPFPCDKCGAKFFSQSVLFRHVKMSHAPPICKPSSVSSTSSTPKSNHTDEKPHTSKSSNPSLDSDDYLAISSDSDDDDIMIIESSSTPIKPPAPANRPVFKLMSAIALSFSKPSASTVSILLPLSAEDKSAAVVPLKVIPKKPQARFSGKRHIRDITKRGRGFYCVCGIKFISRRRLDSHLNFHHKMLNMKKSKMSNSQVTKQSPSADPLFTRRRKLPSSSVSHGVHPSDLLKCLCGYQAKFQPHLTSHITHCTSKRKFHCSLCPKSCSSRALLDYHYRRTHGRTAPKHNITRKAIKARQLRARERCPGFYTEEDPEYTSLESPAIPLSPQLIPIPLTSPVKHKRDTSKRVKCHRCICGLKFSGPSKLEYHIRRETLEPCIYLEDNCTPEKSGGNSTASTTEDNRKFMCMTCGEKFETNVERIHHRMEAHGHGLI